MMKRDKRERCSIDVHYGHLRLRWRFNGKRYSKAVATWGDDPAGWERARKMVALVEARLDKGVDPRPLLNMPTEAQRTSVEPGVTVAEFYRQWIVDRTPHLRKAQQRDYRKHLEGYVLPRLGDMSLRALRPPDIVGLQADLLMQPLKEHALARLPMHARTTREDPRGKRHPKKGGPRTLSVKYVKNILCGSLQAMLRDARRQYDIDVRGDLFDGLDWKRTRVPDPDPFEPGERDRILEWFRTKAFGLGGRIGGKNQPRPHPPYHALVHTLFWTGMRPSEAAGLQLGDIDLKAGTARVERSFYLGALDETKTAAANRTVELTPETTAVLHQIMPLRAEPDMPVFTNVDGRPVDPHSFTEHWYRCLRALGIRVRGLYATKDTFVSLAMTCNANPAWLEQQTGVAWATLRKHYGKYMPRQGASEMNKLRAAGRTAKIGSGTAEIGSEDPKATLAQ
jgi:integrase